MLIHLCPKFYGPDKPKLVFYVIQPWGLCLSEGKQLAVHQTYSNKHFYVACRNKDQKATHGLLIETQETVTQFHTVAYWEVDNGLVVAHKVNYEILDTEFPAVSEAMILWSGFSNWPSREPDFLKQPGATPMTLEPIMTFAPQLLTNLQNKKDTEKNGFVIARSQHFKMPTIDVQRILEAGILEEREPKLEDAFQAPFSPVIADRSLLNLMNFPSDEGTTWANKYGDNHRKWPRPVGQPLTWEEWARRLSDEGVRRSVQPQLDFFPWDDEAINDMATTCWLVDWVTGKTPEQVIEEESKSGQKEPSDFGYQEYPPELEFQDEHSDSEPADERPIEESMLDDLTTVQMSGMAEMPWKDFIECIKREAEKQRLKSDNPLWSILEEPWNWYHTLATFWFHGIPADSVVKDYKSGHYTLP